MVPRLQGAFVFAILSALALPSAADADNGQMAMPMQMPMQMPMPAAHPTENGARSVFTANHEFLVKLVSVPTPIPYETHFDLRFAVFDGHHPERPLPDADLSIAAGMRHGMARGFAHGMDSAPKIEKKDGIFTVSGMYFHMAGPWVVSATIHDGRRRGTAEFALQCCGG